MGDYELLDLENLAQISDYLDSVQLELLTEGVGIEWESLEKSIGEEELHKQGIASRTYYHAYIKMPHLQRESRFVTLFPPDHCPAYVNFTRNDTHYRMSQDFHIGSFLNNEPYLKRVVEIEEGDEWKFKRFQDAQITISVEQAREFVQQMAQQLGPGFTVVPYSDTGIAPRPLIAHQYGNPFPQGVYSGSVIRLPEEMVRTPQESSLIKNVKTFYQFFKTREGPEQDDP